MCGRQPEAGWPTMPHHHVGSIEQQREGALATHTQHAHSTLERSRTMHEEQEQQVIAAMEQREDDDLSSTPQFADDREMALYKMRHSAAHIMAEAVLAVFPEAKLAIGPPIEDGF